MAFIRVCDKCSKILDDSIDEVEIKYKFKRTKDAILKTNKTVNLCGDCYRKIFGEQLDELKNGGEIL